MLNLEEYISRRKKEDSINEFDLNAITENTRISVNYVFEYFNNYLPMDKLEDSTFLKDEKVERYRRLVSGYSPDVENWLVDLYSDYGKYMHKYIAKTIDDEFFLLYNKDNEFSSISYSSYSKLIKKFPFIKEQTELLFQFIKDYHRVKSNKELPYICDQMNEWMEEALKKNNVNLAAFAYEWIDKFYDDESSWPMTHRIKGKSTFRKYDYNIKQKSNLFNLDSLYRRMPKKAYIKGRKQEMEILMMYYWFNDFEGDDEGYWQEYLQLVLPSITKY